jgi:hypothetical protein
MSIEAPQGILNIPNATLRVGRLEINEVVGADTALNTIARNTILLVDDVTYHENKNWGLKLPNAWAGEFECNTASAGNYSEFNFYNEGASSNAQGYNLTFNDTDVQLRYDGTLLKTGTLPSTVTGTGVKKVRLMFERTILSVTVDGTLIFTHDDTGGPRPRVYSTTAGGFLNFFTDGGALKNLKIVNEKWISDGTSNIAYVGGGEVAVGQSLNLQQVSNTSTIKANSNVVTEFPRSKKLIKYPRVALLGGQSGVGSGYTQDGYTVKASSEYDTRFYASNAFDSNQTTFSWLSAGPGSGYRYTSGSPITNDSLASSTFTKFGAYGEWLELKIPTSIYLNYVVVYPKDDRTTSKITSAIVWGSNTGNDGAWQRLSTISGVADYTESAPLKISVESRVLYNYYALQITTINPIPTQYTVVNELQFWGVPEYDPEAHGTDVTIKSYPNVPNTDWLEVYYDAKGLANGSTTVNDLKPVGTANNGTVGGNTSVTDEAFTFDGTGDYITSTVTTGTGNRSFSVACWFNFTTLGGLLWGFTGTTDGTDNSPSNNSTPHAYFNTTGSINFDFWASATVTAENLIEPNRWYAGVWTYDGNARKIYIDGTQVNVPQSSTPLSIIDNTSRLSIGIYPTNLSGGPMTGSVANFRLFNRALTSDEVWQLYAYQKEYFGHGVLGMTLKAGRLGIGTSEPRAMLDVRGSVKFSSGVPIVYNSGSWGSGTEIELGRLDWNNYNYHQIRCRFVGTNPVFQRYNARIRARYAGEVSFKSSGYESFGSALKFTQNTTLQSIYSGTDGPLVAYYSDSESSGNSDAFLIIDIANILNGRPQIQFTCSYTYGGYGQTRVIGGSHVWVSTGFYESIKLYFEQFDANNTVTGSYGDWVIIGYR